MSDDDRASSALAALGRVPRDAQVKVACARLRDALASGDDVGLLRACVHAEALLERKGFDPRQLRDRMGRWTTLGGLHRGPRSHLLSSLPERELRRRLAGDGGQLPSVRERRQLLDALEARKPGKRRVEPQLARGAARVSHATTERLRSMFSHDERASRKARQPVEDIDGLYALAGREQQPFAGILDLGAGVAKRLGARIHHPRSQEEFAEVMRKVESEPDRVHVVLTDPKDKTRAAEKAQKKYGGDAAQLTDIVRGTISVPHVDDIPAALDATRAEMPPGWQAVGPTNRFVEDPGDAVNRGATSAGYRDVQMLLRTSEGWLSELQILTNPMFVAKQGRGHQLYEEIRKILETTQAEDRDPTPAETQRLNQLEAQSKALYDQAFQDSTRPQAVTSPHVSDQGRALMTDLLLGTSA